jgi:lipoic acid synthetase
MDEEKKGLRKPAWLLKKVRYSDEKHEVKNLLKSLGLHTVCESARCPNLSECFHKRRATFLILGNRCTRSCAFCSVEKVPKGIKLPVDKDEPRRVVEAAKILGLKYVVITSVTRDDLEDGGATQFARTVELLRAWDSGLRVEVLTPDFRGDRSSIDIVANTRPDVFNHNVETVPRLYPCIRPQADYKRSIDFIDYLHRSYPGIFLKSGLMVGLGEQKFEVIEVLRDLRNAGCDAVTIGHYIQPCHGNVPIKEFVPPEIFEWYGDRARALGFRYVASGPFVRSSYMADEGYKSLTEG